MTLFKHWQRMWLALPQAQHRKGSVSVTSRLEECRRLLTEPWTDDDRRKAEEATRAYLASVEAGC